MKKVIIACGAGLATSTMIAEKVKTILEEAGIEYSLVQSQIYELDSHDGNADLIITSMKIDEETYKTPIVIGTPFIMGINEHSAKEEIIKALQ